MKNQNEAYIKADIKIAINGLFTDISRYQANDDTFIICKNLMQRCKNLFHTVTKDWYLKIGKYRIIGSFM